MSIRNPLTIFDRETILYILKRLLQAIFTLFLASILSFVIIQLAPGDYLDALRQNPKMTEETLLDLQSRFGLDQPILTQYGRWLWRVVRYFDFGISFESFRPVHELLLERMPATLLLALTSIIGTWAIAIPLGILSAVKQNTVLDKFLRVISYLGQGLPSFITALALLMVAQQVSPLLPVGGMTSINFVDLPWYGKILDIGWHMILPTIALSLTGFAGLQRLTRGQLLDVLRQDYIQTARAKGLPENRVIYVHALRNAINPLITLLGFEFASLLSGSFISEFFFNWPGLGTLTLQAVQSQDLYLVMAALMMSATMLIVGNLLADLMLKFADPRIKLDDLK
ncbi:MULTISPECIES: ABC transporter permease [Cyanophyceae]|uniref:ABC transporter permease n=1 Tax=Cyanophyceae TaxID=3028117 RepID=UPI00016DCDB5|nr:MULTISPECIES: ABC transporter permease [Cyanophyceae]ACB00527.1 OppB in a binding protein-dependent transport system [Picosynechococcus sp. PCC 7002]SMH50089.1 peptide/nickel transport system permease protein [Picosynechococcus sp. OG1]SMQ81740.1 peptide/nickel transport system permease protein [Synechococcus sp. 7002]